MAELLCLFCTWGRNVGSMAHTHCSVFSLPAALGKVKQFPCPAGHVFLADKHLEFKWEGLVFANNPKYGPGGCYSSLSNAEHQINNETLLNVLE